MVEVFDLASTWVWLRFSAVIRYITAAPTTQKTEPLPSYQQFLIVGFR
jgi:hypothetical protein